jgi:ParB-like chromosome segregation protein Spo0J
METPAVTGGFPVEMWPLDKIIPYPNNARKITQQAIDKVAASLTEFGWRQPIVVDKDGVIVVGHARHFAARFLNLKDAPVHVAKELTPEQIKAYRLADNRLHEETTWDRDLLKLEMEDLGVLSIDLTLTGFDMIEIDDLFTTAHTGLALNTALPGDAAEPLPTTQHVRMIQVFVPQSDWEQFRDWLATCSRKLGTSTTTDTILQCVESMANEEEPI